MALQSTLSFLSDDIAVESMFDVSARYAGMSTLRLYLEIDSIYNRDDMDTMIEDETYTSLNCYREFGGPSTQTFEPIIPVVNNRESLLHLNVEEFIPDHHESGNIPTDMIHEDLATDSEDDEDYLETQLEGDEDEYSYGSDSSSDKEENDIASEPLELRTDVRADYPFYNDIGEGSYATMMYESNFQTWNEETKPIVKGLRFANKMEMQYAMKRPHILNNWRYKVMRSTNQTWVLECLVKEYPCNFNFRASLKKHNMWEVTRYMGPHSCLCSGVGQDHPHLNAKLIAREVLNLVKKDADLKISVIIEVVNDSLQKQVSYKKAWFGKQKAIAQIYGDWETSYVRMPKVLAAIKKYNPRTVVEFTNPPPIGTVGVFDRVFWVYGPCLDAFPHCRPVISVDGTFLHGRYRGVILIAMGIDANNSLIPLAFAIIEKEDFRNWHWFLTLVIQHVVKGREVCIKSDCHQGILKTFARETGWINVHHRFCLRHVRANFLEKHKGSEMKRLFWVAGCSTQDRNFRKVVEQIQLLDRDTTRWFEITNKKWTLAHDGGYRYGVMTTNLCEIFNGVMKGARGMLITAIVEMSFYRCVAYFEKWREIATIALGDLNQPNTQPQHKYSHKMHLRMHYNDKKARKHQVRIFDSSVAGVYSVTTGRRGCKGGNVQIVRFGEGYCSCEKWRAYNIPCSHVIACCKAQHVEPRNFVSPFYNVESYYDTWKGTFQPLEHEDNWNVQVSYFCPHPFFDVLRRVADLDQDGFATPWIFKPRNEKFIVLLASKKAIRIVVVNVQVRVKFIVKNTC